LRAINNIERISSIQRFVAELKIHLSTKIACSGSSDDLGTAIANAAEFSAAWAVTVTNFLDLIFRRNSTTGEAIYDEGRIAAGSAACSGDLLEVCRKFILVVRQRIDEIAAENGCAEACIGVNAEFGPGSGDFNILGIVASSMVTARGPISEVTLTISVYVLKSGAAISNL